MKSSYKQLKTSLKNLTDQNLPYQKIFKIVDIDLNEMTCTVATLEDADIQYFDVYISVSSDSNIIEIPKVGSIVLCGYMANNQLFILKIDEADKILISNSSNNFLDIQEKLINDLISAISNMTLNTPVGPTVPIPINVVEFETLKTNYLTDMKNLFYKK